MFLLLAPYRNNERDSVPDESLENLKEQLGEQLKQ
jgi:hypothetical protein